MKQAGKFWKRREWLGWSAGGAAAWLAAPWLVSCGRGSGAPRNIVLVISDGMSQGVPSLAEPFSQRVRGRSTHWHALLSGRGVAQGLFDMASEASLVTDSAAAASAWASGRRVPNGLINQYDDGTRLKPLVPLLQEMGKATGLVTTARLTHATPAGFLASVPHRNDEEDIALQYAASPPEVLLGGGSFFFDPEMRADGEDLRGVLQGRGMVQADSRRALLRAEGQARLFGCFALNHLPYTLDQKQNPALMESVPTLAEMTRVALRALEQRREGFFLMVEGARIDHAAHANCAAGMLWEQLACDDALGEVLSYQQSHPDTLVIATSDHGNGNPGLNGMGLSYRESNGCFARLARAKATAPQLRQKLAELQHARQNLTRSMVQEVVLEGTGFSMTDAEAGAVLDAFLDRPGREVFGQHANFYGQLGQILGNWNGVGWTGVTHTADWTLIAARGPGQEAFQGLLKNTDFFDRVCGLWDIRHSNPPNAHPPKLFEPEERAVADPTA